MLMRACRWINDMHEAKNDRWSCKKTKAISRNRQQFAIETFIFHCPLHMQRRLISETQSTDSSIWWRPITKNYRRAVSEWVSSFLTAHLNCNRQKGLAVASIARDDPSPLNSRNIGGGHVSLGSYDRFNFAGWRSRCVPGMHRDPMHFRHRETDTGIIA